MLCEVDYCIVGKDLCNSRVLSELRLLAKLDNPSKMCIRIQHCWGTVQDLVLHCGNKLT